MADGTNNSVNWQEPGYDEGNRETGNRMFTDYDANERLKTGFKDRRKR